MKSKTVMAFRAALVLLLFVGLTFCKDELKVEQVKQNNPNKDMMSLRRNPTPQEIGKIPATTVQLKEYSQKLMLKDAPLPSTLLPANFETTLRAGSSATETKTATITSAPPKCDILFMMDLTGSMGDELANTKANSINIMNSISSAVGDAQFGVVSHMDYPAAYTYCGYSDTYGNAGYGDYPYKLNQAITSDNGAVTVALNSLSLGNGWDGPESYARVLYETTADIDIAWRTGTKKIVIAWLDAFPHDCGLGTGRDPGRDGFVGNTDDPEMAAVVAAMAAKNITLIVLNSGEESWDPGIIALWEGYASSTSGASFKINTNGTIPDGTNIDTYLTAKILEQTGTIDNLSLEICTPEFEGWLSNVNPESYTDLNLTTTFTGDFGATFTVPAGTVDGTYEFDVCLIGDGAEYGRQHVKIKVVNVIPVPFDIKPAGCPNPVIRGALGVLPAAILGFSGFNVTDIDPVTIKLEGIPAIRWALEDVGAPYLPFVDKVLNQTSCNTAGPDGMMDLTLKFDNPSITALMSAYKKNDVVKLHLTGALKDGTPITGEDVVIIVK